MPTSLSPLRRGITGTKHRYLLELEDLVVTYRRFSSS
jgi:hypothetical protein